MTFEKLPGVDLPTARIALGTLALTTWDTASQMLDTYVERGGNLVDTAWVYGDGVCEELLGRWMEERGTRDSTVILTKGAHTPDCYPSAVGAQLSQSLERLRTDRVDVYLLHRDNPDVPVDEFVDAMESERAAGRVRAYGFSNCSRKRIQAGRDYADRRGFPPIPLVSNNVSLAEMAVPPWPGCVASSTPAWGSWFAESGTVSLPWSSQAQGFFAPGRVESARGDVDFQRAWMSEENLARLRRVNDFADKMSTSPVAVALAYVLHQPYPTFPVIGTRNAQHLDESIQSLHLALTPADLAWLSDGVAAR